MTEVRTPHSCCQVGVARCDITPPVGIYHRMWGAAAHDRSTGVHRPLTATALWLAAHGNPDGPGRQRVLVALDHCLLWHRELTQVREAALRATGLDEASLDICFSHTHAAGLMGLERSASPGGELIAAYLEQLGRALGELCCAARAALEPATIVYGTGSCRLAAQRDYFDAALGSYVCGFNPTGSADDTVVVGRITADQGPVRATLVNYACHPTTLAWQNTLISPDFVGALREVVEQATAAPCFFLQGASGDLGPREGFVGEPATADRNGRCLGFAALSTLETLPPPGTRFCYAGPVTSGATLGTWQHVRLTPGELEHAADWRACRQEVPLAYRSDLPARDDLERDLARWSAAEQAAQAAGHERPQQEARAMVERATRGLTRVSGLPSGSHYPFVAQPFRIGDAVWILIEGEHYQFLQRELRRRFPSWTLVVGTLTNGSNVWYLPTAESYGKGLYQESASVLARGSLEQLIDALSEMILPLVSRHED